MYIKKTTGYVVPLDKSEYRTRSSRTPDYLAKPKSEAYVKKMLGYVITYDIEKGLLDVYYPPTGQSSKWKHWVTIRDIKRCLECRSRHGQIYAVEHFPEVMPPLHPNCRCKIEAMEAAVAGTATKDGKEGADYWIYFFGQLPDYYITYEQAKALGWIPKRGNLHEIAPWTMIGGSVFSNKEGRLPEAPGRIWYEADINYQHGFRNKHRILYSNDGLLFVTYDHYWTFIEIVGEVE